MASIILDKHGTVASTNGAGSTKSISITATNGSTVLVPFYECSSGCVALTSGHLCSNVTVADDGTNTYTLVCSADFGTVGGANIEACLFKVTSWSGGTKTATATSTNGSPNYMGMAYASFIGTTGTTDGCGYAAQSISGLRTVTTAGNLTANNDLVFSLFVGSLSPTWSKGAESTTIDDSNSSPIFHFHQAIDEYFVGGTSGATVSATATPSGSPAGNSLIVALK